jgi:glycosidase
VNIFEQVGLEPEQLDAFNFTRRLLNWRKSNKAVQSGEFTQYIPENGVYVYFRHTDDEAVMVLLNNTEKESKVNLSRFAKNLKGYTAGRSVLSRTMFEKLDYITVPAKSPMIVELMK